jgi:hypothetical protein
MLVQGSHAREAYRATGAWIDPLVQANRVKITAPAECLTASCALLALEVILWTVNVIV